MRNIRTWVVGALALLLPAIALTQAFQAPRHTAPPPVGLTAGRPMDVLLRADSGMQIERDRLPAVELDEHRKLARALDALAPQRAGIVDAYVLSIALDSDPVFGREAREAGNVLQRRYDAAGRTLILAGTDGSAPSTLPRGTPTTFAIALARIAELMDRKEDVLVLFTTSHGAPWGLYYNDADSGHGAVSPNRLKMMLDQLGLANRLLVISACYSGVFIPVLQSDTTAILTAASNDRTSFGCAAENDWTYYGDAMVNRALRKPQPLDKAYAEASALIARWESQTGITPSRPQVSIGAGTARWLGPLERRMPTEATRPVGRPAFDPSLLQSPKR